jgi:hypothetical protein
MTDERAASGEADAANWVINFFAGQGLIGNL